MTLGKIKDVQVPVQVVLGGAEVTVEQRASLGAGSIFRLAAPAEEPVTLMAAGEVIAKGEVVVIDESLGIRVTETVGEAR